MEAMPQSRVAEPKALPDIFRDIGIITMPAAGDDPGMLCNDGGDGPSAMENAPWLGSICYLPACLRSALPSA